ncbi:MAG: DegT/DnrJ/EryC1/StrS aminotransferase family protein [Flavobacteriales bacterium]|nr:DegT/DnrJ/EryC1/StrS aminotransferase family protein [Flavobacteriales bacterium]
MATHRGRAVGRRGHSLCSPRTQTLCLSAEGIRNAITPNTKAVLLSRTACAHDLTGSWRCKERKPTIEDTAQALGAAQGEAPGLYGDGQPGFDFFKINTCGEGAGDHGRIPSRSGPEYLRSRPYAWATTAWSRIPSWAPTSIGDQCAIGLAQARKLLHILETAAPHTRSAQQHPRSGLSGRKDDAGDSATFPPPVAGLSQWAVAAARPVSCGLLVRQHVPLHQQCNAKRYACPSAP